MIKLIRLELKRNSIKKYIVASIIISIVMFAFIYALAFLSYIGFDNFDSDLKIFTGYDSIISWISVLSMVAFTTLSAVMYTRFVIDEYKQERKILLLSYPQKRNNIFLSKLTIVFLFTTITMIICNLFVFLVFSVSENVFHLVDNTLPIEIIQRAIKVTILTSLTAGGFGIVAMGIGFIKNSVPMTIISGILIPALFSNIVLVSATNIVGNDMFFILLMVFSLILGVVISTRLMKKINIMEV